ncbi:unnamed protein product [Phytophthora lilii]|uniref:Histone H4 n=1 Tax=Phytophthora lilii TaxID=2077276 RepID=A0A9W6WV81_9STRA|nr:unnamed protein product [Phytophthora lilii]
MSGRGKYIGQGASRRHRFILQDSIQGISKKSIRRLARRAGVIRMSELVYDHTRAVLKVFVRNLLHDAIVYTQHANRRRSAPWTSSTLSNVKTVFSADLSTDVRVALP